MYTQFLKSGFVRSVRLIVNGNTSGLRKTKARQLATGGSRKMKTQPRDIIAHEPTRGAYC